MRQRAANVFDPDTAREGDVFGAFTYRGQIGDQLQTTFEGDLVLTGTYEWLSPGYNPDWLLHVTVTDPVLLRQLPLYSEHAGEDRASFSFVVDMPHEELEALMPHDSKGVLSLRAKTFRYLTFDIGANHAVVPQSILEIVPAR